MKNSKLCILCHNPVPPHRKKYCSKLCIKRMWNIKHLSIKESFALGNPQKGIKWEEWFINKFGAKRPSKALNTSFDFFWNDEKIDLKVCELYKRKMKRGKPTNNVSGSWVFNRNGDGADFIVCICLINSKPIRAYKIPNETFPKSGATIGFFNSKYDKYRMVSELLI